MRISSDNSERWRLRFDVLRGMQRASLLDLDDSELALLREAILGLGAGSDIAGWLRIHQSSRTAEFALRNAVSSVTSILHGRAEYMLSQEPGVSFPHEWRSLAPVHLDESTDLLEERLRRLQHAPLPIKVNPDFGAQWRLIDGLLALPPRVRPLDWIIANEFEAAASVVMMRIAQLSLPHGPEATGPINRVIPVSILRDFEVAEIAGGYEIDRVYIAETGFRISIRTECHLKDGASEIGQVFHFHGFDAASDDLGNAYLQVGRRARSHGRADGFHEIIEVSFYPAPPDNAKHLSFGSLNASLSMGSIRAPLSKAEIKASLTPAFFLGEMMETIDLSQPSLPAS